MPRLLWIIAFCFLASPAWAALPVVHQELAPARIEEILELFPEAQEVGSTLLDYQVDPNIRLFREAEIFVTFFHEGARLRNSFGYFLYEDLNDDGTVGSTEILRQEIIFPDVNMDANDPKLRPGDTAALGKFPAGTRLGFYLIADGTGPTYYTLDELNPDGHRHLAMLVAPDGENIALGIEDLPWEQSDHDFNDILFTFTTEPKAALQEIIDSGNIPCIAKEVHATPSPNAEAEQGTVIAAVTENLETTSQVVGTTPLSPLLEGSGRLGCSLGSSDDLSGLVFWALASLLAAIPLIRAQRRP